MSKQTSIEWLVEQYEKAFTLNVNTVMTSIIQQAQQMHNEEIIDAFFEGAYGGDNISGEQYYQETYGGQDA